MFRQGCNSIWALAAIALRQSLLRLSASHSIPSILSPFAIVAGLPDAIPHLAIEPEREMEIIYILCLFVFSVANYSSFSATIGSIFVALRAGR
jgi:hypothetical protein